MHIGVVALPGCWDSGLTTVLDVLRTANAARRQVDREIPAITAVTVAAGCDPVPTAGGLLVPVARTLDDCVATADLDLLLVPALAAESPATMVDALMRPEVRALRTALLDWSADGRELAAACTGTFVLAEAGLLDDRQATTSWWLWDLFRRRYPRVGLDVSRMVVRDGTVATAGAAFAHIDLAMSLVARVSPQLAHVTATALLIDERPAGSVTSVTGHLAENDQLVNDFESWVRSHLQHDIAVVDAALALGTTRRTLERRVRERLNITPYGLVRRLRAERAGHLRRTTDLTMTDIARLVGYRNASSLRALLRAESESPDGV
ncbi:GlxA family transcriptional regulator [Streptomyces sp. NPDC048248]|uniref:GlxA family transcriptional regulator n=1 Tax=Streptomyces sp. NPDC048248 TaxID=3365523 RepID=UPI00371E1F13